MTVDHLEVLVEEASAEAALRLLLPRMLGATSFEIYPHHGKSDLLLKLPSKLRAYARWLPENARIAVVVDRDDDDCEDLKAKLEKIAKDAGLITRSAAKKKPWVLVNRIAIEELEAWYFGDWTAVRAAYPRASSSVPRQAKHRHPDRIVGGTWEAFERVMQRAGYFDGGLPKIDAARAIAQHMDPTRNTSPSFGALRDALLEMRGHVPS